MSTPADDDARLNTRHALNAIEAGLARAASGVEELAVHSDLSTLALQVAGMLADDIESARRRLVWLQAAHERRDAEGPEPAA